MKAQILNGKVHWLFDEATSSVGQDDENGVRRYPPDMVVVDALPGWETGWIYDSVSGVASPPPPFVPVKSDLEKRVDQMEAQLNSNLARIEALERRP